MSLPRQTAGRQRLAAGGIKSGAARRQFLPPPRQVKFRVAIHIEADFHAIGMKTSGQFQRRLAFKIMPFHAEPVFLKTGPERTPTRAECLPGGRFTERARRTDPVFGGTICNHLASTLAKFRPDSSF